MLSSPFLLEFLLSSLLAVGRQKKEISVAKLTGIKEKIDGAEGKRERTCLSGAATNALLHLGSLTPFYLAYKHLVCVYEQRCCHISRKTTQKVIFNQILLLG